MYTDDTGNCTIGHGHKIHDGKCGSDPETEKEFKDGITKEKANDLFEEDIEEHAKDVDRMIDAKLTQSQYDALASFTFNVGADQEVVNSDLVRKINKGASNKEIKQEFMRWNKGRVDGEVKELDGLSKRRAQEANMFTQDPSPKSPQPPKSGGN